MVFFEMEERLRGGVMGHQTRQIFQNNKEIISPLSVALDACSIGGSGIVFNPETNSP